MTMTDIRIVDIDHFDYFAFRHLPVQTRSAGNPGGDGKKKYKDVITAFDIETTRIPEIEQSVMYVWQWAFGPDLCVMGRTWDEYKLFVDRLQLCLKPSERLVIYVHNLSFEFCFLRGIMEFGTRDVFAVRSRKVLKCSNGRLEWRCSYLHSNMSLKDYLKKMGAEHQKAPDFKYDKPRYSFTALDPEEIRYCVNDVIGLVEAITIEMAADGDNLYTIPATSTGYVRRDIKHAMRGQYRYVHDQLPTWPILQQQREAFRGGDTHGNRYFTGQIVHKAKSKDRSSSYPDVVCNCKMPISRFFQIKGNVTLDKVLDLIITKQRAVIMRVAITNLRLKDHQWPAPYLSLDKCRSVLNEECDNGRILECDYLETTITDIDLRIILREYEWDDIRFFDVSHARYGKLPRPLVDEVIKYYRLKTELKNVPGQGVFYTKAKNKANSIYGLFSQWPGRVKLLYYQHGIQTPNGWDLFAEDPGMTEEQANAKAEHRLFVCYQWGCWVTAWARYRLREAIWAIIEQGGTFLYCDTDSVKYLGDIDFTAINEARKKDSLESGSYATDPSGEVHYMGVFESEQDMLLFKHMGAKKYCYVTMDDDVETLHSTIAGVAKSAGAAELLAAGKRMKASGEIPADISDAEAGLWAFEQDFVFTAAGGLEAIYNDEPTVTSWEVDGHIIPITANVTLRPGSYTLGLSGDYTRMLLRRVYSIDI